MSDIIEPQYSEIDIKSMLSNLYNKNPLANSNKSEEELIQEMELKYLYNAENLDYEKIAAEYNITEKQVRKIAQKRFWSKRKAKLRKMIGDSYKTVQLAQAFPDLLAYGINLNQLDDTFNSLYQHIENILNSAESSLDPRNLESLTRVMDSILKAKKEINKEQQELFRVAKERLDLIDQNDDEIDEQQVLNLIEKLKQMAGDGG